MRSLLVLTSLFALASCGYDAGPYDPPDLPAAPVVDSAQVIQFAANANLVMQRTMHTVYSGQGLGTPNPFILPTLGAPAANIPLAVAAASASCTPVQTGVDSDGVAIDSDLDGIPNDLTVDFGAGCSVLDGGLEYTFSGNYRLRDPNDGIVDWDYTTTALAAQVRDTLTGDFFRHRVAGTEIAHFTPGSATHLMDVTQEVTYRSAGDSGHVLLRTKEGSSYVPTAGSIFQPGALLPQGTLTLTLELTSRDVRAGTDSLRSVISTPTPIHTSFDCMTGIDAGELRGLFEGDARVGFRYLWAGCVTPELQLFGTTP